jgi:hypothetical protein
MITSAPGTSGGHVPRSGGSGRSAELGRSPTQFSTQGFSPGVWLRTMPA